MPKAMMASTALALLLLALACLSHAQTVSGQTCAYTMWSSWSVCNQTDCSGGWQARRRVLDSGDFSCNASLTDMRACNSCRKDCVWSAWSQWSNCSASCDMGSKMRGRTVLTQSQYGGKMCEGNAYEITACQLDDCSDACVWTTWSAWSKCSLQCGGGVRSRWIVNQRNASMDNATFAKYNATCNTNATMYGNCNTMSCYICEWGEWSLWSECSTSCGEGQQLRTRNVTRGTVDGSPCDNYWVNSHEYSMCEHGACPDSVATITQHINTIGIVAGVVGFVVLVALAIVLFFHCRNSKKPLKMPWTKKKADVAVPEADSDMKVVELTEPN